MQTYSNTNDRSHLEELILSCQPFVEQMAHKYASENCRVEYEEFVSIGMLEVCKVAPQAYAVANDPKLYLCKAAHHEMIDELNRMLGVNVTSLDASLTSDSSFSLADLLPDVPPSSSTNSKRVRALNGAIQRLHSAGQRAAVLRRAGLPGYGVHNYQEMKRALKSPSEDAARCLDKRGRQALRNDARLRKAMGLEGGKQTVHKPNADRVRVYRLGRMLRQRRDMGVGA